MKNVYEPNYQHIDEILLKEIVFEANPESADVTIFGYCDNPFMKDLQRVDYYCDFSQLTDLLWHSGERGELVIEAIAEHLNLADYEEDPISIDVEYLLGHPLKINGFSITIYRPMEQDEQGEWQEDTDENFFIIDSLTRPAEMEDVLPLRDQLADQFKIVENAYRYYLLLAEGGIDEKKARKKAGLKNNLLFKMAGLNHRIINMLNKKN